MARSRIFFFILFDLLHRINCLQLTDWTYDAKADLVIFNTNGATHSCPSPDLVGPFRIREFDALNDSCLCGFVASAFDPSCVRAGYPRTISDIALLNKLSYCNHVPVPTITETLGRIENVFRSSSLEDNPATLKWYHQVWRKLMRMENDCRKDGTWLWQLEKADIIRELAAIAYNIGQYYLPKQWNNVTDSGIVLQEALKHEQEADLESLPPFSDTDSIDRERLFAMELLALEENSAEKGPTFWHILAQLRAVFVENMSRQMKVKDLTAEARRVVGSRMDMLHKMALANEMLARIQYLVKKIASDMELLCLPPDDFHFTFETLYKIA